MFLTLNSMTCLTSFLKRNKSHIQMHRNIHFEDTIDCKIIFISNYREPCNLYMNFNIFAYLTV